MNGYSALFAQRVYTLLGDAMAVEDIELTTELRVFEQHKQDWVRSHPGEFVVIVRASVAGFYPDYESAFKAGLQATGIDGSFLVKQVYAEEPVYLIF